MYFSKPRCIPKVDGYCKKLIELHDELADLKSYFDGVKHSSNPNPDSKRLCSTNIEFLKVPFWLGPP